MDNSLATLLAGPAKVSFYGETISFRGGLQVVPLSDLFEIAGDSFDAIDQRAADNTLVITGTPVGRWTANQIAALWRTANLPKGSLVTPRYDVDSFTALTDVVALVGTRKPRSGCPVRFTAFPGSTLDSGLTAATTYFWGASGKVYDTEAHALTDDGTGKANLAGDGTGDIAMIEQETLVVDAITANRRITFHNAGVINPPPVVLSAVATLLGQVAFGCFRKEGANWADANSLYTVTKVAITDSVPDAAEIPTQRYGVAFGESPWDSFRASGPITIAPSMQVQPIVTDGQGQLGMLIGGRSIAARLTPYGFTHQQMMDLLGMQGGTAARGKSKVRGDLVVSGTGVHCTVYNGAPRQLPQTFQTTGQLAGELEIVGSQNDDGDLFRFATAAP